MDQETYLQEFTKVKQNCKVRSPFKKDNCFLRKNRSRYKVWELTEFYSNLNTDFPLFSTLIVSLNAIFFPTD